MDNVPGQNVLVCPLDWGLGHAARCVPIIKALEARGKTYYWLLMDFGVSQTRISTFEHIAFPRFQGQICYRR